MIPSIPSFSSGLMPIIRQPRTRPIESRQIKMASTARPEPRALAEVPNRENNLKLLRIGTMYTTELDDEMQPRAGFLHPELTHQLFGGALRARDGDAQLQETHGNAAYLLGAILHHDNAFPGSSRIVSDLKPQDGCIPGPDLPMYLRFGLDCEGEEELAATMGAKQAALDALEVEPLLAQLEELEIVKVDGEHIEPGARFDETIDCMLVASALTGGLSSTWSLGKALGPTYLFPKASGGVRGLKAELGRIAGMVSRHEKYDAIAAGLQAAGVRLGQLNNRQVASNLREAADSIS